jgi:23S rRNA pseudouridine1911/1915/1917 synthase
MEKKKPLRVEEGTTGRLDVYVKSAASLTRSQVQRLIDNGKVFLNGKTVDAYSIKIKPGDLVEYIEELPREYEVKHEDIPLDVVFEDENLLVINRPGLLCIRRRVIMKVRW